jgi:hypothetical protein
VKPNHAIAHWILWGLTVSSLAATASLVGCTDLAAACREGNCLASDSSSVASTSNTGGSGGAGPSTSVGGAGGDGGGGGSVPPSCDPDVATDPVADSCGIFVSSSLGTDSAQGDGTKARPFATLSRALEAVEASGAKAMYLCAEAYQGAVLLPAGLNVYGGLECSKGWKPSPSARALIQGPADTIALRVYGGGTSVLRDLSVTAADAKAEGGSSIALMVTESSVVLDRVDLVAGNPSEGSEGVTEPGAGKDGLIGVNGKPGCINATTVSADPAPEQMCEGSELSVGGVAGNGMVFNATNGTAGVSEPEIVNDNSGAGQQSTSGSVCMAGKSGLDGAPGLPGDGAMGLGTLGGSAGYTGVPGGMGKTRGNPGQGGGGGGGASGKLACTTTTFAGPSGGSGGTGGCGGKPGAGGGPGGSSIALVSLNAKVEVTNATFATKNGAKGGSGSPGQPGGAGLAGGMPGMGNKSHACPGGAGGNGGRGGAGGGGLGGHSIAIAYVGSKPVVDDASVTSTVGEPGPGGAGGLGGAGNEGGAGAPGVANTLVSFNPM